VTDGRRGSARSTLRCIQVLSPVSGKTRTTSRSRCSPNTLLRPSPGFGLSGRVLPGEHFEFWGGEPAGRPRIARTRRSDPAI
jgi:hypothetical protein